MSSTEMFIYWVVIPVSLVFAYKRIPLPDLHWNAALWAIPFLLSQYVMLSDNTSGLRLWGWLAVLLVIFIALVYLGDRLDAWFTRRNHG